MFLLILNVFFKMFLFHLILLLNKWIYLFIREYLFHLMVIFIIVVLQNTKRIFLRLHKFNSIWFNIDYVLSSTILPVFLCASINGWSLFRDDFYTFISSKFKNNLTKYIICVWRFLFNHIMQLKRWNKHLLHLFQLVFIIKRNFSFKTLFFSNKTNHNNI